MQAGSALAPVFERCGIYFLPRTWPLGLGGFDPQGLETG